LLPAGSRLRWVMPARAQVLPRSRTRGGMVARADRNSIQPEGRIGGGDQASVARQAAAIPGLLRRLPGHEVAVAGTAERIGEVAHWLAQFAFGAPARVLRLALGLRAAHGAYALMRHRMGPAPWPAWCSLPT